MNEKVQRATVVEQQVPSVVAVNLQQREQVTTHVLAHLFYIRGTQQLVSVVVCATGAERDSLSRHTG